MKIALCTSWDVARDGIADYSRYFAEGLRIAGADVRIVPLGQYVDDLEFYRAAAAEANKADVIHIQFNYLYFNGEMPYRNRYLYFRNLLHKSVAMTCHEIRPELAPVTGALSMREAGYNSTLWLWNMLSRRFHEKMYASSNALIVHSQIQKKMLLPYVSNQEKIAVITHGIPSIDEGTLRLSKEDAQKKIGFEGKTVLMVYGFINKKKGYECILEAFSSLGCEYALVIAGGKMQENAVDNAYERYVRELIQRKGLTGRIRITGYLDAEHAREIFAATDICLAPFSGHSASGALSLCLAYHKPVIASDIPVHQEIQSAIPCLELVPAQDSTALAHAITELRTDTQKRSRLEENARRYSREYSYTAMAQKTIDVYRRICQESS